MKIQMAAMAAIVVGLSACGGSGSSTTTTTTTTPTTTGATDLKAAKVLRQGTNQATRVEYDSTTDEMIIESIPFDDDVFEGRYARTPAWDRGAYQAYVSTNGFDQYIAYFDTSASGAVKGSVVGTDKYLNHGYSGAMYARNGAVTLPSTTQRAFYNGDYVGLKTFANGGPMDIVTGDAKMEVDFSDDTVRGTIENRVVAGSTATTGTVGRPSVLGTITFANTGLDRTTGAFNGGIATANRDGNYEGLLADGTGSASEMAGIVLITDSATDPTNPSQENGTFIAIQ